MSISKLDRRKMDQAQISIMKKYNKIGLMLKWASGQNVLQASGSCGHDEPLQGDMWA